MVKVKFRIKEIYKDSTYEEQLKAPILRVLLIVLLAVTPPTVLRNITSGNYIALSFSVILTFVYTVSLILLYRGKYTKSADISIITTSFFTIIQTVLGPVTTESYFLSNSYVGNLIVLLSVIFISCRKRILIVTIGYAVIFVLDIIYRVSTSQVLVDNISVGNQVSGAIILFLICSIMLVKFRGIVQKAVIKAEDQADIQKAKAEKLKELADKSQQQISKTTESQKYVEATASSVYEIENSVKSIRVLMEKMVDQFTVSEKSLKVIEDNVTKLDRISTDQSANITETSASLEEMVASIKNVNNIISTKSALVKELQSTANRGNIVINKTDESFNLLSSQIGTIREMLGLITNISSQTNLLAMNAAIEAAHAGESGKGFAVVADEIRKLAESSSSNVKQISDTIKDLMLSINTMGNDVKNSGEAFTSIDTGVKDVDLAMSEISSSVNELSVGSDEILRATSMMNDLTSEVVESVKTLRENDQTVISNIDSLGSIVLTLTSGMDEISSGAKIITNEMDKITQMSIEISDFNRKLNKDIEEI